METLITVLLWLLGVVFLMAGAMKALAPASMFDDNPRMAWVAREGVAKARLAGVTELVAAVIFLLTALSVVEDTLLAGLAAVGLVAQMALAAGTVHAPNDEPIVPTAALGALAAVLAGAIFLG